MAHISSKKSSQDPDSYSKLKEFSGRRKSSNTNVSRSVDPNFKHIHKMDDVTRYDAANFNVSRYKNYPNRAGTPIKLNREKSFNPVPTRKSVSPQHQYVKKLFEGATTIDDQLRKTLYSTALGSALRTSTSPPVIIKQGTGKISHVINDDHSRESNAAYSRNKLGGFYTR
jgi:hypothetical protein